MKTIAFLLSACLLLGSAAAGAAPSDAEQLQTDAYVQVVQGDQSFDAGRLDEALGQYQEAKRLYERLAAMPPGAEGREELCREAGALVSEDAAWIFLGYPAKLVLRRTRLKPFAPHAFPWSQQKYAALAE